MFVTLRRGIESSLQRIMAGALLCLALAPPAVASQAVGEDLAAMSNVAGCAKIGLALILVGFAFLAFRRSAGPRQVPSRATGVIALVIAGAFIYFSLPASGLFRQTGPQEEKPVVKAAQGQQQIAARRPVRPPTPIPTRPPLNTPTPAAS